MREYFTRLLHFVVLSVAFCGLAACSSAPPASAPLPMGFATAAPAGYVDLCHRDPAQCPQSTHGISPLSLQLVSYQTASPASVAMTTARWKELDDVNISANQRIRYVSDQAQYGVQDYWAVATTAG